MASQRGTMARRTKTKPPCSVDGCENPMRARTWCTNHYQRWERHGDPLGGRVPPGTRSARCSVSYCQRKQLASGYCEAHYARVRAHGDPQASIPLKAVKRPGEWRLRTDGYMGMSREGRIVLQHREVMEQSMGRPLYPGETVHHKNGDRTDNRLENLELWITRQPYGQRVTDRVMDALETLRRYAPEQLKEGASHGES